jgi:UDP-3-O-[3-hydroxymyristoyl] N-acetylglucosamine deacetylase
MRYQQTISKSVFFNGVGLHSGKPASLAVHPAPLNTGIVFVKQIGEHITSFPANIDFLGNTDHCTTLQFNGFQVQTVEHILAALWGQEIDNVYLEFDGGEVPAVDGSAAPFMELLQQAGVVQQPQTRTYIKIIEPISVGDGHRSLTVHPSALPKITYRIDFPNHPMIRQQEYLHICTPMEFSKQIAAARTFAFQKEIEYLWSHGLGLGGSLQNTVVFSDSDLLNEEGLRFPDECVRHKVLDLIGDMALLGTPVIGHFQASCAGHWLHTKLVQAIKNQPEKWILLNAGERKKEEITEPVVLNQADAFLPDLQPAFSPM